jgi:branched-chain amino acid transport system permease protein
MNLLKKLAPLAQNQSPFGLLILIAMAVYPFISDNIFHIEIIKLAAIYAIFAMSWDILTGYTHEVNFGFAFFIGGAGYLSGILSSHLPVSLYLAIPVAALAAGASGIFIGYVTLRLKGPYFAMATLAFASILYKLSFILYEITGGEEGISGLDVFTDDPMKDFFVVWGVMVAIYFVLCLYARSKHGIILKAIRADEDATQSAGINTAYYKIEAFAISGFMAGIGGGVFAHSQMHIGPTMLSGYLSVIVVLLAMIGGMGTIVGPLMGAICLSIVNESLRIVEEYRIIIYTGLLILFIYLAPDGLINLKFIKGSRLLSFIVMGDRTPR